MMYMLDTNICIYAIKNKPELVLKKFYSKLHEGICISSITLAELEHGVTKSNYPEKNKLALLQFLSILTVVPFDESSAAEYGKICAYLQTKETPIGTMDMLIAGHAKACNLILVTNNVKEFIRVPELQIEDWTE